MLNSALFIKVEKETFCQTYGTSVYIQCTRVDKKERGNALQLEKFSLNSSTGPKMMPIVFYVYNVCLRRGCFVSVQNLLWAIPAFYFNHLSYNIEIYVRRIINECKSCRIHTFNVLNYIFNANSTKLDLLQLMYRPKMSVIRH